MSKNLFEKVKKLNLPKGEYAIFASGPLGIRNIRECRDIDLIVTEDLFEKLNNNPDWKYGDFERDGRIFPHLEKEEIEAYKTWGPEEWDIMKLIKEAEIIDDLPFVRLEEVLKWKKISGRDKDIEDVKLIEDYLIKQKS